VSAANLDLNLLHVLVALGESRSVSAAALKLEKSQPAVSARCASSGSPSATPSSCARATACSPRRAPRRWCNRRAAPHPRRG
jgi:hypothetical protein